LEKQKREVWMPVQEMAEIHLHSLLPRAWCLRSAPGTDIAPPQLELAAPVLDEVSAKFDTEKNAMTSTTVIGAVEIM
jgi:hypothetical protein